jgi:hypothetical protein
MTLPLDTGDRVAWTERDRGIVVAADPVRIGSGRRLTLAVWECDGFSGHLTRIPGGLLYRTSRLRVPAPRIAPPRGGDADVRP